MTRIEMQKKLEQTRVWCGVLAIVLTVNVGYDILHSDGHLPNVGDGQLKTILIDDNSDSPSTYCDCTVKTTWLEKTEDNVDIEHKNCGMNLDCNEQIRRHCQEKIHDSEIRAIKASNPDELIEDMVSDLSLESVIGLPDKKIEKAVQCLVKEI